MNDYANYEMDKRGNIVARLVNGNISYLKKIDGSPNYPTSRDGLDYYYRTGGREVYGSNTAHRQIPVVVAGISKYAVDEEGNETYPKDENNNEYYLKLNGRERYAKKVDGRYYYAKDAGSNEIYARSENFEEMYIESSGREIYTKTSDRREKVAFAADGGLRRVCARDVALRSQYYPKDANLDEYYDQVPCLTDSGKTFYPKDQSGGEIPGFYLKDSNGNEVYPKRVDGKMIVIFRYAKDVDGKEIYPQDIEKNDIMLQEGGRYVYAKDASGEYYPADRHRNEYYAENANKEEYFAKRDGYFYARSKGRDKVPKPPKYATDANNNEFYPRNEYNSAYDIGRYAVDKDGRDIYPTDERGNQFYILDSKKNAIYIKVGGRETVARNVVGEPVPAKNSVGRIVYPKTADGKPYYPLDAAGRECYLASDDGTEHVIVENGESIYIVREGRKVMPRSKRILGNDLTMVLTLVAIASLPGILLAHFYYPRTI